MVEDEVVNVDQFKKIVGFESNPVGSIFKKHRDLVDLEDVPLDHFQNFDPINSKIDDMIMKKIVQDVTTTSFTETPSIINDQKSQVVRPISFKED